MTPIPRLAACLALALAAGSAAAQPVHRCGNGYSHVPCAGGIAVETQDGPSASDRAAAERALAVQKRQGATMAAERERREAAPRKAPANVGPAVGVAPAASAVANLKPPRKAKGRIRVVGAEDFTARAPAEPKPRSRPAP